MNRNGFLKLVVLLAFLFSVAGVSIADGAPIVVYVNGMVCDFCARALEKTFLKHESVDGITVDLTSKKLTITLKEGGALDDAAITDLVRHAGYAVERIERK